MKTLFRILAIGMSFLSDFLDASLFGRFSWRRLKKGLAPVTRRRRATHHPGCRDGLDDSTIVVRPEGSPLHRH